MLLHPGEKVLRTAHAVREGEGPRYEGVLYLTNFRLLFETHVSKGFLRGREPLIPLEVPLEHLENLSLGRTRLGRPRLVIHTRVMNDVLDVLDPEAWMHAIADAKVQLPSRVPGVPTVVVNVPTSPPFDSARTIERQVIKVRCRHCGGLYNEVDGRCPNCGAPL
ncbi:MAG: hypothetical protein WCA77_05795 [Thermoplasmata archaeon]